MPVKRALVCGVAEYGHLQQTDIPGALRAAEEWAARLESFGFESRNILLRENEEVTKTSVLNQLRSMFAASGPNDDVMFIIACHGTSITRDDAVGEEQGLVLYPKEGDRLLDATLFGSEIAEAAGAAEHGDRTHFNVVFDCCHGEGINPPPPFAAAPEIAAVFRSAVPLRIIPPGGSRGAAMSFVDSVSRPLSHSSKPSTMVIAAVGANDLAYEGVANDGQRWTFFSYAALQALSSDPNHSYRTLVEDGVRPYLSYQNQPFQIPVWRGDRPDYQFARRSIRQRPAARMQSFASATDNQQRGAAAPAASTMSMTDTPQLTLNVLIFGISCIAAARTRADGFKRRVLFPTDDLWFPSHHPHLAFLEVEEDDLLNDPGTIVGLSERYTRFGRNYRRFELNSHKITIDDVDPAQGFSEKSAYLQHVPQMTQVQPHLSKYPHSDCYLEKPPASLVAGYLDIDYGMLGVRRLAPYASHFLPTPPNQWLEKYWAISPQLTLKLNTFAPTIRVENLDSGYVSVLRLKPSATEISIGNLTALTLAGSKDDDPPHDFKLFYNLAEYHVDPEPVPDKPIGIETACLPVGWP